MNIDDDSYSDFKKGSLVNKDSNQGLRSNSPTFTNHIAMADRLYSPLIGEGLFLYLIRIIKLNLVSTVQYLQQ